MRSDGWAGWAPGVWTAGLWGSPELPRSFRQHVRNRLRDRFLYLDTMRLDDASIADFLGQVRARRHCVLFGHAHSLFVLAEHCETRRLPAPDVRGIVSTSMSLLAPERAVIERVFGRKVSDRYGCEEVGLIAAECEQHAGLHANVEHVHIEVLRDDGSPAPPGEVGRVVVTDLLNNAMPMVRYEVGDLAAWATRPCPCGRGAPTLERLAGRVADCFRREDGSLIAGISLIERTLTAVPGIAQLQLVQTGFRQITARIVLARIGNPEPRTALARQIEEAFGYPVDVQCSYVQALAPQPNGKYRFTIREIP